MPCQEPPIGGQVTAIAPAVTAVSCCEVTPASRVNGTAYPPRECRTLPVLVRHARSGVPVVSRSRSSRVSAVPLTRTSGSKGHYRHIVSAAVLDLKFLYEVAAQWEGP